MKYYREIRLQLPPSGLSDRDITIAWNASPSPDVGGYSVHYGLSSGNYPNKVFVGKRTSYTLPGLAIGKTYYIAVTTHGANGTGESDFSGEIVVKIPDEPT